MRAAHFPVFLDLEGRRCLVVGTDDKSRRKSDILRRAGATVLRYASAPAVPKALDGLALVIVSGGPLDQAADLSRRCRELGIPVNVVDEPVLCSFLMPALVERGPITVAISTGGRSPLLAKLIRHAIDQVLPARLGDLAELAGDARPLVRGQIACPSARLRFWGRMLSGPVARLALSGRMDAARTALFRLLETTADKRRAA